MNSTKLTVRQVQHLFWRAGFGASAEESRALANQPLKAAWAYLLETSSDYELLQVDDTTNENTFGDKRNLSRKERDMLRNIERIKLYTLNLTWLARMASGQRMLREKMTLFWHGHFATRTIFGTMMQRQNNMLRHHAFDDLHTLLTEIVKDPAMLFFLNNQQNRKGAINENFAREFLELFTMGRGNYTEEDIRNAARAFTGWRAKLNGESYFEPVRYDSGEKTFLGQSGSFDSNDIIRIVLQDKRTATHIATRAYRFFVSDQVNKAHVTQMADTYYQSGYKTNALLESIFLSEWFYSSNMIGSRIKSPVELLAGFYRAVPLKFSPANPNVLFQKALGQIVLLPPGVAGWEGGRAWIDSSTIVFRISLAGRLLLDNAIELKDSENPVMIDEKMVAADNQPLKRLQRFSTIIDWNTVYAQWKHVKDADLAQAITAHLLQVAPAQAVVSDKSVREEKIKELYITLMSLPEYQMC